MATKTCPNGHQYDSSIYGDNCPFCPENSHTHVNNNNSGATMKTSVNTSGFQSEAEPTVPFSSNNGGAAHTVIRNVNGSTSNSEGGRKVIGLLVSYSKNPAGDVYKIYEGRNIIGRDNTCDVCISGDDRMSSRHLLIQYIDAKGTVRAKDMGSSNGTYINGQVYVIGDVVELKTNDVIVMGATKLVYLAIPEF